MDLKVFGNWEPTTLVIPEEEFRQFRTREQGPMRRESTSCPHLPPKEPGTHENGRNCPEGTLSFHY